MKFLAQGVLLDSKVVTFREVSRALHVHNNTAKQMLYDFHKSENEKRPGAVYVTYVVFGTKKKPTEHRNGADDDVEMTSSMPDSSPGDVIAQAFSLDLIPEELLEDALEDYEEVRSIHVYSAAAHSAKDMALLADTAQEAHGSRNGEDNLSGDRDYVITNPSVRRRERKGAATNVAATPAGTKVTRKEIKSAFSKPAPAPSKLKEEVKASQPAPEAEKASSSAPAKKPTPSLKRGGSANSGIMQAFSKAATMAKKEKPTSQPATPSGDDSSVQPMSDDGEDDSEMPQPKARAGTGRKSRKEREEELRRMMEEEDEDEEEEKAPSPEPEEEPPASPPAKEEPAEIMTTTSDGRRRGKRKIMRKKQIMDDQGYLVTIQEPGWESFSEDEPALPPKKTTSSAPPAPAAKGKKSGPKGNQGSIMSFFSKK